MNIRDTEDPMEMSLFETLRENIYSEVATLISQNENRPHYLIELFRELQLLTTDYLRQRVLYDIKDVVSKYLVEENSVSAVSLSTVLEFV
jgi:pericentriolar material 1 protein